MIDFGVNPVYANPVLHIEGTGLASCKVAAQAAIIAVFLCTAFSPISYDGVNGALARVAGATPVRLTPLILSPMISLVGDGFTTYYRVAIMNTLQSTSVQNLPVVFWQDQPVITTESLASVYEVDVKNIHDNFKNNAARFVEGQHYFKLAGQDLKGFSLQPENIGLQISNKTRQLILWTERGTVRHAKMLGTDKAWEVQDQLEQFYFTQKSASKSVEKPEAITLADIEKLIDQKLIAQKPAPQLSEPKSTHICNTISSGVKFPEPAPGCIRCISDIDIAQLARELSVQGYRISRI